MATPPLPLTEDTIQAAIKAIADYGSIAAVAREWGMSPRTLQENIAKFKKATGDEAQLPQGNVPISQDESKIQTATREEMIAEILRVVEQDTTKVITRNHFRNESRYAESAMLMHFGTFEEAKRQANVTLSRHAHRLGLHIAKHASVDTMRRLNEEKQGFEGKYLRPSSRRFQTAVVCSDLHGLRCDPFYRRVLLDTILRVQPEKIIFDGDIIDAAEFSKHLQDPRQFKVVEEIRWLHTLLADVTSAAPEAEKTYVAGNHESRWLRHLAEQTPAMVVVLSDLHGFTISKLLGLDKFEINYIDRGDLTAWNERDIKTQLRKNYITLWDNSLLFGHFPEMRSMGIPGANGHHHKHIVWPFYSPVYGPAEWHQMGAGHVREASFCAAEKWGLGFLLTHCDTHTKRSQFEYIDVSHPHAFVGGKFYERMDEEPIKDLLA